MSLGRYVSHSKKNCSNFETAVGWMCLFFLAAAILFLKVLTFLVSVYQLPIKCLHVYQIGNNFKDLFAEYFSVLHLNIRSVNFEAFQEFYKNLSFTFSIVCFSKTWTNGISKNSTFQLDGYTAILQIRKSCKGGGTIMFVRNSLSFKQRNNLSTKCEAIISLSL